MIRWLEGVLERASGDRLLHYAADTPLGRATIKPVRTRLKDRFGVTRKGPTAWRGRLADGTEIERASAQDCMVQLEAMINLQLERKTHG